MVIEIHEERGDWLKICSKLAIDRWTRSNRRRNRRRLQSLFTQRSRGREEFPPKSSCRWSISSRFVHEDLQEAAFFKLRSHGDRAEEKEEIKSFTPPRLPISAAAEIAAIAASPSRWSFSDTSPQESGQIHHLLWSPVHTKNTEEGKKKMNFEEKESDEERGHFYKKWSGPLRKIGPINKGKGRFYH